MEVFITWSGARSKIVAEALRDWLPRVIQSLKPWISVDDINKGAHWRDEISQHLATAEVGIVVLTPDNLIEPWLLFEAGAISKNEDRALVCTYLVGLDPTQVADPLAQFQATVANKEDTKKLLSDIYGRLGSEAPERSVFDDAFEINWPRLQETLDNIPSKGEAPVPERSDTSILLEILSEVRASRRSPIPRQPSSQNLLIPIPPYGTTSVRAAIANGLFRYAFSAQINQVGDDGLIVELLVDGEAVATLEVDGTGTLEDLTDRAFPVPPSARFLTLHVRVTTPRSEWLSRSIFVPV